MPARKIIRKQDIPNQHTTPSGMVVREFTKEEFAERSRLRREGKLVDAPAPELLPADSFRKRSRHNVTLAPGLASVARKLGNGNLSRGIDAAITHYVKTRKPGRPKKSKRNLT